MRIASLTQSVQEAQDAQWEAEKVAQQHSVRRPNRELLGAAAGQAARNLASPGSESRVLCVLTCPHSRTRGCSILDPRV